MDRDVHAWAATRQGAQLEPFNYAIGELGTHECLVEVAACGICHSDIHMMDNDWGMASYPLVPGHEVVGRVAEVGRGVRRLAAGDRVGIGWQASSCGQCPECLRGDENLCDEHVGLIVGGRGGFADLVKVDARFAFRLPEGIETLAGGPLLCGGITVYSALRAAGMRSGQRIGVIGVGGLGHMAVLFASRLGNQVTAFTTSPDKAEFAGRLGAHEAVLVEGGRPPAPPARKLDILLNTVAAELDWPAWLEWLGADGTLMLVAGPAATPVGIPFFSLLMKRRRVMASPIGGRAAITEMLEIADRHGIRPQVETFPLARVNEALERVRQNKVRYRAVVTR